MIDSIVWILGKSENGLEWYRDEDTQNDSDIINYNNLQKEKIDFKNKELKS